MPETVMRGIHGKVSECPLSEAFVNDLLDPFLGHYKNKRSQREIKRHILTICSYFYKTRGFSYEFHMLDENDAKEYFLVHLSKLCQNDEISYDTFCTELSAARSFGNYLVKRITFLRENNIGVYLPYENPFLKIVRPASPRAVRTERVLSDQMVDSALYAARDFDTRLYIIFLFAFRMMIPCRRILALDTSMLSFIADGNNMVGILSYAIDKKQTYLRMPADIVYDVKAYYDSQIASNSTHLFSNEWGRRMNPTNLSKLMDKMSRETGISIQIKDLRCKGLLDLVAHNPDNINDIIDYTGLSKQMIEGYGNALDYVTQSCIADSSGFRILQRKLPVYFK